MLAANERLFNTPLKQQARYDTIISEYRRRFQRVGLEWDKQYWTMCSQCATAEGEPLEGSEYDQLTKSGLILPSQWRGVDINPAIVALNQQAYPNARWIDGDFYWQMAGAPDFHPGIVNIDTMVMPDKAAPFVADIMDLCSRTKGNVMLVANIVTRHRQKLSSIQDFLEQLTKEPRFHHSWQHCQWHYENESYEYRGKTTMSSVIFIKD